jgi:hypothetical protein
MVAGANANTNNLIDNLEIPSARSFRSIIPARCIRRPWNVLQYLPRHARQLGNVRGDAEERFLSGLHCCAARGIGSRTTFDAL